MNKVPKLRFSKFSGEWQEKRLGDISEIIMGQSPNSIAYNEKFEGIPLIQGNADCKDRKIIPRVYTTEITKRSNQGDIIMSVRAPAGTIAISNIKSCIGRGVCAIRAGEKTQSFIFQYLINYEKNWIKYSQGSTFDSINSNVIKELELLIPNLPEQEEISSFLSSVDTKIEKVEKKVELLKQYKKGMMQKIFSQEIRFKDENGNDYPDWVEKELGEVFKYSQGQQVEIENQFLKKLDGMERFLRIVDITQTNEPYRYIYPSSEKGIVNKKDLFMVRYGAIGKIGYGYQGIIANNLFSLKKKIICDIEFMYHQLTSEKIYKKILSLSASTSMPALSFSSLNHIYILNPTLIEQEKIANFLSSLDKKIERIEKELEQIKEFKKGLLQQMFV